MFGCHAGFIANCKADPDLNNISGLLFFSLEEIKVSIESIGDQNCFLMQGGSLILPS